MKVIALGTGTSQGIPLIGCTCEVCQSEDKNDKRLRSSVYIETEKAKILIDIGPDFRHQFLTNKLSTLDLILITHEHNDHIIGLDDVRAINFVQNKSILMYAHSRVAKNIRRRFEYVFGNEPYPGVPKIDLRIIDDKPLKFRDIEIMPLNIMHGKLPIWGFRLNDFVYITDGNLIPEKEFIKMVGIKVLIINALRKEKHYSHFTLDEALGVIERIKPERAFITHISHNMGKSAKWRKLLPSHVSPLTDKMIIEI